MCLWEGFIRSSPPHVQRSAAACALLGACCQLPEAPSTAPAREPWVQPVPPAATSGVQGAWAPPALLRGQAELTWHRGTPAAWQVCVPSTREPGERGRGRAGTAGILPDLDLLRAGPAQPQDRSSHGKQTSATPPAAMRPAGARH